VSAGAVSSQETRLCCSRRGNGAEDVLAIVRQPVEGQRRALCGWRIANDQAEPSEPRTAHPLTRRSVRTVEQQL
jgi:hypothetical protein